MREKIEPPTALYRPDRSAGLQPKVLDSRWNAVLIGLPCLAFVVRDGELEDAHPSKDSWGRPQKTPLPYLAEITGIEGYDVYVVLDDETEPRKVSWWNVRPR